MPDIFQQLPKLSWRGVLVPFTARETSFEQDNVQHKIAFRNGELVEATGQRNRRFSYTIPFRDGITKSPFEQLFSKALLKFVGACADRAPGQLQDPVLGVFRARCSTFRDTLDVSKRDGVDVAVEFIEDPSLEPLAFGAGALVTLNPTRDASDLDAAAETVDWRKKQVPPPESTVDVLSAIDGIGRQLEFNVNKVSNSLNDAAFRLEKMQDTIDRLQDPNLWTMRASVRRLLHDVRTLATGGQNAPSVRTRRIARPTPVQSVADSLGVTVPSLMALNPTIAQSPTVPGGTTVRYISPVAA